jgi:hypothetical protein
MLNKKIITLLCGALISFIVSISYAGTPINDKFHNPFYVGLTGGYGSTTWGELVPPDQNAAMSLSTPVSVSEGGFAWGLFAGYEFIPQFGLEASYMHYQAARLYFDPMSLFSFNYDGLTELTSRTESVTLMAKIMLVIPTTTIRVFSSAGAGGVHRYDAIKNIWRLRPTFGAGFNYNITDHWMTELGVNYIAGYGVPELNPTKDYVPFLYSAFLRIAYRF